MLYWDCSGPVGLRFGVVCGCNLVDCRASASLHATVLIACGLLRRGGCVRRLYTWPSVVWQICEVTVDYIGRHRIDQFDLPGESAGNDVGWWYGSVLDKSKKYRVSAYEECIYIKLNSRGYILKAIEK